MKRIVIAVVFGLALLSGQAPPPATAPQAATAPQPASPQPTVGAKIPMGSTNLENASLTLVIDQLARLLKLNIIVDPAVKGNITLNTYGDPSGLDARNMLEMILRINGFGLIQDGDLYRVLPLKNISHLPMHPEINQKNIPEDDQTILNLVFLKYVNVDELVKVLKEFAGENSDMIAYPPANLLFLLDSRRNMRRTMELIAEFDSDTFANQRVRLFEVKNVKPSDVAKDLDNIFKSISLDAKTSPVRFIGIDRINTLIAVASNPGAFENVADWLKKLDIPVKITAGSIENYVYRVKYGRADCLGQALTQLFNPGYAARGFGANAYANNGYANNGYANNGYGNNQAGGAGGYAGGGYGGGMGGGIGGGAGNAGGYGNQNSFNSNFGGSGGCNATGLGGGGYGGGYNAAQAYGYPTFGGYNAQTPAANATGQPVAAAGSPIGAAAATPAAPAVPAEIPPRIIPNPLDNKLIIQANAEQYQNILKILTELDVPPRQILLEAKIYSVTLSDSFTSDITATLAKNGGGLGAHQLLGNLTSGSLGLTAGTIVGQSRQLLLAISANENKSYTKLLSEPSLIATDSIPASISVGTQVPVSTGSTTVPSAGGAVISQSVSSENTGITLQVNARVNSSGVVTLIINQENSSVNNAASNANGTAFSQQVVQTQITMMDGDTIAIGGLIDETYSNNISGIPGLVRIPWIGWLFGSKSVTKERDELIMFFTPHVIFDESNLIEASDELKARVKMLKRDIRRL
ncbi:MAG TPA: type II secretion system secretin GspD [Bryobacteraceae bacterium]|nr:type II secretion system secretin GspD [Bryobacteraceae bacterium]